MTTYHYIIWLEVHIKLNTTHKLFCLCVNTQEFDSTVPNTHICPTCTAQPWSLPIINPECINTAIRLWTIFQSTLQKDFSRDRKSYFYADSPTWFQITQFHKPIIKDGAIHFWRDNFQQEDCIHIHEAHLENDTAKTITVDDTILIDYNRSGSPLIEIVTKPEFTSDDQVVEFLKELQKIVKWNNIGYADLEKGQMRVDVNISTKDTQSNKLWTRVEVKNINSYAAIRKAIHYEFKRHKEILQSWWAVDQETRKRDDTSGETLPMRTKEQAMDYRYIPEGNLPHIDPQSIVRNPPVQIKTSYQSIKLLLWYGFQKEFIFWLINSELLWDWFSQWVERWYEPKVVAKRLMWQISNSINILWENWLPLTREQFIQFLQEMKSWWHMDTIGKLVMEEMLNAPNHHYDINTLFETYSSWNIDENTIQEYIHEILTEQASTVLLYKTWKTTTIAFFIWQLMKKTWWTIDPNKAKMLLEQALSTV